MSDHATKPNDDSEIERQFLSKDKHVRRLAYAKAYEIYREPIYAYSVLSVVFFAPYLSPDDVFQETFLALFTMAENETYEPTGSLRPLLYDIVRRRIGDGRRRNRRERIDGGVDMDKLDVEHNEHGNEAEERRELRRRAVLEGLNRLTAEQRHVFTTWLMLFRKLKRAPSGDRLARAVCGKDATQEEVNRRKGAIGRMNTRTRATLRVHLERLRQWP